MQTHDVTGEGKRLREWWATIVRAGATRLSDHRGPLVGLERVLNGLELDPIDGLVMETPRIPEALGRDPKFKNLTGDCLPYLRYKLLEGKDTELAGRWAEKVLRYCEIQRANLRSRVQQRWADKKRAKLVMLQVMAFLLDYCDHTRDLRYLNTSLKLADQSWIITPRTVSRRLQSGDQDDFVTALFEFRNTAMIEHTLREAAESLVRQ